MNRAHGFTLIELAIVLVIITILIGGLVTPLTAQIQARRIAETRAEISATRDAVMGFAMSHTCAIDCTSSINTPNTTSCQTARTDYCASAAAATQPLINRHFLPCPDVNGDGREDRNAASGECTNAATSARGGLPWLTLGVKGHDAWGNRLTYAVTQAFAAHSGFASTPVVTPASLMVYADRTCISAVVAENVPLVIVSHGANGRGATNVNGGTPLAAASVPAAERQNLPTYTTPMVCSTPPPRTLNDRSFISRNPDNDFDDITYWMSSGELFNRVCPAGGCL